MNYAHPFWLAVRYRAQKLGILRRWVSAYRRLLSTRYEQAFEDAILSCLRPGEVVWDVGANVGHFTTQFADRVGAAGHVVAFEPAPASFSALQHAAGARSNVQLENLALGDADGELPFYISADETSPANGAISSPGGRRVAVPVLRGDSFCHVSPHLLPHHVKIDVEGFECEVLHGIAGCLRSEQLRSVFVEVHFTVLKERGLEEQPAKITGLLQSSGFQVWWTDSSHIVAHRPHP